MIAAIVKKVMLSRCVIGLINNGKSHIKMMDLGLINFTKAHEANLHYLKKAALIFIIARHFCLVLTSLLTSNPCAATLASPA